MIRIEEVAEVGKLLKTHGLAGELNAVSDYDFSVFTEGLPVIVMADDEILVPYKVTGVRPKGTAAMLITFEGVDSVEKARRLVNKTLYMRRSDLAGLLDVDEDDLDDGWDIEGYEVVDAFTDHVVGRVVDVDDTTPGNLLIVMRLPDGENVYIPSELMLGQDDELQRIQVEIPDGLLDLNRKEGEMP